MRFAAVRPEAGFGIVPPHVHIQAPGEQRRAARGFSLIELLIAITVFALVALGISSSTLAASRANRVSEARTAATMVAQDLLECLRLERIVGDTLNGTCSTTVPSGYTASVATSNVAPGVQLSVTVTWTALPGGSVTLTTHAL